MNAENDKSTRETASPSGTGRKRLFVKTFGCQMNEYDSEKLVRLLGASHSPVSEMEQADLVMINTCSVREKGEHKLFSLLGELRELKQTRPELLVGVMGCVAQQEGEAISKRNKVVDLVVGTQNLSLVPSLIESVQAGRGRQIAVDYREEWEDLPLGFAVENGENSSTEEETLAQPEWTKSRVRALVSIQRGCNKNCSYCVVPTTRGPEVSRDPSEILREISLKARLGAKEVLLLGQTVNSFGRDLEPRYAFETLIREISQIPGIERIRFISPHPAEVKTAFLKLYSEVPQLMPHIHLPLQSGSDRILRLMNRNYKTRRYREIVEEIRSEIPNIAITTDIIVGFPTETEEDFEATMDLVRETQFQNAFSFKYSRRPNTTAIVDFKEEDEVESAVAQRRLERLQTLQTEASKRWNERFLGTDVPVLIEAVRRVEKDFGVTQAWGKTPENTPVEIMDSPDWSTRIKPGDIQAIRIQHSSAHGFRGSLVALNQ